MTSNTHGLVGRLVGLLVGWLAGWIVRFRRISWRLEAACQVAGVDLYMWGQVALQGLQISASAKLARCYRKIPTAFHLFG